MYQREIIRFAPDIPIQVVLDSGPHGKLHSSGDYQYIVNGNRGIVFGPPPFRDAIIRSGAQKGDAIEIVMHLQGGKQLFDVYRISDAREPNQPESRLRGNYPAGTTTNGVRRLPADPPAPTPGQPVTRPAAAPEPERGTSHLSQCMCMAIDVAAQAQDYARLKGISVQFTGAEIQDLGVTLYINDCKREGY